MTKVKVNVIRVPMAMIAKDVWAFLLSYLADNDVMPTLREIAEHFSDGRAKQYSVEWARKVLKELERQGKIKIIPGKNRGIEIRN